MMQLGANLAAGFVAVMGLLTIRAGTNVITSYVSRSGNTIEETVLMKTGLGGGQ